MMNHIAVVFRGHLRTWTLIKDHVLNYYDNLAKNVDYYFVTYKLPNKSSSWVEKDFTKRNLISFLEVPIYEPLYSSYIGPAWLNYNVIPYKRLRERHVTYDAVIDTRPDIMVFNTLHKKFIIPENNCLYTKLELHTNNITKKLDIALQDWFFVSKSNVFDIMATRFVTHNLEGTQISIRKFAENENIKIRTHDMVQTVITRPNIAILARRDIGYRNVNSISANWINLPKEEKLKFCLDAYIDPEDYKTDCILAKI